MIQCGFIGLMGGGIGGVLSITIILIQKKFEVLVIPSDIYFMDQIPFSFDLASFGVILFITLLLSIISSWWPTKTLTQINAAKTLRYE
jgi:lipoprotein-releasing system permease protein